MKSAEQKDKERKDRIAAAEAREKALKGDEKKKTKKAAEKDEEAGAEEKPKRGDRRHGEGAPVGPAKKRTRTGVKTG